VYDDAFTLAPERARAICQGIIDRGLQLPFDCQTRADRVDRDLLRLMKRAGFVAVSFGLESAVPHVLRTIGKVQDPATDDDAGFEAERAYVETVRRAVIEAKQEGLAPSVAVIEGLPGESPEDFAATLAFVRSLGVETYSHNVLSILPGTPLFRDRARHGMDAARDPATGVWRTSHPYDVNAVAPLANAMTRGNAWEEAKEISDALCGIPRRAAADEGAAWAVVLHRDIPDARIATWVRDVLAVHGAVVIAGAAPRDGSADARWAEALTRADAPFGILAALSRVEGIGDRIALRSLGTIAEHRFDLQQSWRACRPVDADEVGGCHVRVWIASRAKAPPRRPADDVFAPTPQIADGCRWWSGGRRCAHPSVLHVWPDGAVTPCWGGPRIGTVGDRYVEMLARAGALRPHGARAAALSSDDCPLAGADAGPASMRPPQASTFELASQMQWLLFTMRGR
jgi:Radical SAM superfamily